MRKFIYFLVYLSAVIIGVTAIGSITATTITYIMSYALDFPMFENIYFLIIINAFSIIFFACCAWLYILDHNK